MLKTILLSAILFFAFCQSSILAEIVVPKGWKEVEIFVESAPKPVPNEKDKLSGFIPYNRNYIDPIYTNSRPREDEITEIFRVTLAKGEYEPFIVAFYGLEDLDNLKLDIQGTGVEDDFFADNKFDIRKVKYRAVLPKGREKKEKRYKLIPSLLERANHADIRRGQTTSFWITVHAPGESVPGVYNGRLVISRNGLTIRTLKLEVVVLPFVLEEIPDRIFSALYTPVTSKIERNARVIMRDMRSHGMTSYSPIASAWGKPLSFDKNGNPKIGALLNHLQWAKEEGFWAPTLLNIQKLIRAGRPNLDANYTKFDKDIDIPNLKKLVLFLEKRNNDWPEIIYIPIDEPGAFTDKAGTRREEMAVLLLKTLLDSNVRGATTVDSMVDNKHRRVPRWKNVVGWWDKIRPYCTVRIYHNGYPEGKTSLRSEMKDAKARKHEVMLYENTSTMGIVPKVSRMYFGYYGWRTGVKGITSWTYPLLGNATGHNVWAGREERRKDESGYFREKEWQLPPSTICWEMVREGIDDAKYLYLFRKLLERNKNDTKKYANLINELKTAVDATKMSSKKPKCNWKGNHFLYFRNCLIQGMLELHHK